MLLTLSPRQPVLRRYQRFDPPHQIAIQTEQFVRAEIMPPDAVPGHGAGKPAQLPATLDDDDLDIVLFDQRVRYRQPGRAAAENVDDHGVSLARAVVWLA